MSGYAKKLRAAVIVDNFQLCRWQREALSLCSDLLDVELFLNCTNSSASIKGLKHCLYYTLNLVAMNPPLRRRVALDPGTSKVLSFESEGRGGWQHIPETVIKTVKAADFDVIIKFGMGLLKDPDLLGARCGVLSFHHGDPSLYRGRPAAFYEMLDKAPRVGIGLQKINNRLDGGVFLGIAHAKIVPHSYSRTLSNAYAASPGLLRKVLQSLKNSGAQGLPVKLGKVYGLPSNLKVASFIAQIFLKKVARLVDGIFFEKRWSVAVANSRELFVALDLGNSEFVMHQIDGLPTNDGYTFQADPFFSPDGSSIYLEALSSRTGLGEILCVDASTGRMRGAPVAGGHYSYPGICQSQSGAWLLPETASWCAPQLLELDSSGAITGKRTALRGLEGRRLLDPTYFKHGAHHYIFAGERGNSEGTLSLFVSDDALGTYSPHPANPVVLDPCRARMGGAIFQDDKRILRVGQNNSYGYGDGVTISEVIELTPTTYREIEVMRVKATDGYFGPHTINFHGKQMVYDFYRSQFSLLAWYRRVLARLSKARAWQ